MLFSELFPKKMRSYGSDANKSDLFVNMAVNIFILISPTVDTARENYYQIIYREDLKNPKQNKFDLNIEDMGKFYSENASNGAKKQDAKITRILEMIK